MSLILRQVIGYEAGKRTATLAAADPELKRKLEASEKALNKKLKELEKERGKLIQALNDEINNKEGGVLD